MAGIQAARALGRSQARKGTEGSSAGVRRAFQGEGGSAAQAGRQGTVGRVALLCILFPWAAFGPEGNHNPARDRIVRWGARAGVVASGLSGSRARRGLAEKGGRTRSRQSPRGTKTRSYCLSRARGGAGGEGFVWFSTCVPSTW